MAEQPLKGLKVAILVTDGFEQVELTEPRAALDEAGAETKIVSPKASTKTTHVKGWDFTDWGREFDIDVSLNQAKPQDYDALLLPGGVLNPDKLRLNGKAVAFVKSFFDEEKPVAAICHGPWTVIEAGEAFGRRMTSWPSLKTDVENAGATWVDQQTVKDKHLLTSRKPDDIPAFTEAMVRMFDEECDRAHAGSA